MSTEETRKGDKRVGNQMVERYKRIGSEMRSAAKSCARRGLKGVAGDPLPIGLSVNVLRYINGHPTLFQYLVEKARIALAESK